jgi:prepilin-type N-terminal cleavage/methylation domain-containing protein
MKKKGFTLSEILIAVCIIGVISGIMASGFNQTKPDKTKMMYLKAYDALTEAVSILVNDSTLFTSPFTYNNIEYDIQEVPFLDTTQPSTNPYYYNDSFLQGNNKFGRLLSYTLKDKTPIVSENIVTFHTGPGNMEWKVTPKNLNNIPKENSNFSPWFKIDLIIDKSSNSERMFTLCVQPDGQVRATDNIGNKYIKNRRNIHSRNDSDFSGSLVQCSDTKYYVHKNDDGDYYIDDKAPQQPIPPKP